MPQIDLQVILLVGVSVLALVLWVVWNKGGQAPADDLLAQGIRQVQQNDFIQGALTLERAVAALERDPKSDVSKMVSAMTYLAKCYERTARYSDADQLFKRVISHWGNRLERGDAAALVDIDYAVTNTDFGRGALDIADFYVTKVIPFRQKHLPNTHADVTNSYAIGARLLRVVGRKEEAAAIEAQATGETQEKVSEAQ